MQFRRRNLLQKVMKVFFEQKDEFIIAIRQKFSYPQRQIKIKERNKN